MESETPQINLQETWDKCKAIAAEEGRDKDYQHIMNLVRNDLGAKTPVKEGLKPYAPRFLV